MAQREGRFERAGDGSGGGDMRESEVRPENNLPTLEAAETRMAGL